MKKKITESEERFWYTQAAGFYLCKEIPQNFWDFSFEEKLVFLSDNAWQPFQYDPGEYIDNCINDLSETFQEIADGTLKHNS